MAAHSSALAWRIPGTGEPGGLPSMGSQSQTRLKRLSSNSSNLGLGNSFQQGHLPESTQTQLPTPVAVRRKKCFHLERVIGMTYRSVAQNLLYVFKLVKLIVLLKFMFS